MRKPLRVSVVVPVINGDGLADLLEWLTDVNEGFLAENPWTPPLYSSGVRYREEPPGTEEFCAIPDVLRRGWGDCDDLAPWRAAELRLCGEEATAEPVHMGDGLWHVVVRRADGSIEDPSALLGMR